MQRIVKPNFAASWEEIGEENQTEGTYALSSMKDIQGNHDNKPHPPPGDLQLYYVYNNVRKGMLACLMSTFSLSSLSSFVSQML